MPMYNLIEYSDASLKTSASLWQYYRDEPALDKNETGVTLNLSSNIIGDSHDENNFPHKLLLNNT